MSTVPATGKQPVEGKGLRGPATYAETSPEEKESSIYRPKGSPETKGSSQLFPVGETDLRLVSNAKKLKAG